MSRPTLCDPPEGWKQRIKELNKQEEPIDGQLLLGVELALELLVFLGLMGETPLAVPAILSATPMYDLILSPQQRLAVANVRQIVPYSSSSAWRFDLARYRFLPEEWRHYDFGPSKEANDTEEDIEENSERDDWEKRLICIVRKSDKNRRHAIHTQLYQQCLTERLPFHERKRTYANADNSYSFWAELTDGEKEKMTVTFPQALLDAVKKTSPPIWFNPTKERKREIITIHIKDDLAPIAEFFDAIDRKNGRTFSDWKGRLERIAYRHITPDGKVNEAEPDVLHLNGFHHAAGMVASGKSTLAALIAGFIVKNHPHKRITLIVGDVQSTIRLSNQLNSYFNQNPETDSPVAVPLLGRSTRAKHLRDLHESADWQEHQYQNRPHWGERFLSIACPLQGLIIPDDTTKKYRGQTIQPGQEPCASLIPSRVNKPQRGAGKEQKTKHLCPLYARCPVHRSTHDMPYAPIWITTPQALLQGSLPQQAEARPIHMGEIVYEHSDLVIIDEADAVMGVFDEAFARDEDLTNGKTGRGGGIYDRIGGQTEWFVIPQRATMSQAQQRWSEAQRGGQNACQILLALLNDRNLPYLSRWVSHDYFTPYSLFVRLARRIAGLSESAPPDEEAEAKERFRISFEPFNRLFGRGISDVLNPVAIRREHEKRQKMNEANLKDEANELTYELWQLLRDISAGGAVFGRNDALAQRCEAWLLAANPGLKQRLDTAKIAKRTEAEAKSKNKRGSKSTKFTSNGADDTIESVNSLANRLIFALAVALLDRHTHIIFNEWSSRTAPEEDDIQPHQNTPLILRDILPLPPLGRQFGTYYSPGKDVSGSNLNRLSFLSYTNIGRWYLLHFHELFSDLRQEPGPHVLALSGTSYLPSAVRLHLGSSKTKPQGLLLPEKTAKQAIAQSQFTFLPLRDEDDVSIVISGKPEGWHKINALKSLARKLAGRQGGYLQSELVSLRKEALSNGPHWADRERLLLLVNSYEQAKIVAEALRDAWPEEKDQIFYLSRTAYDKNDYLAGGNLGEELHSNAIHRPDIETFGTHTNGKILVAPMNAIGRGYNILNKMQKTAAFGAIYFLIRPYPHPDDMTAIAREMNRRTLDWAENESFSAWNSPLIEQRFRKLRQEASDYWDKAQRRRYWRTLHDYPELQCEPRKDLAAYTAGLIVQSVGRLLRGGVPFHAFFVDAAFAPFAANYPDDIPLAAMETKDAPYNSLLAAVIVQMDNLIQNDPIARELYEPLSDALSKINYRDGILPYEKYWNKKEKI